MSNSLLKEQTLFGLFELDAAGTVLYSRVEREGEASGPVPDVAGLNFYEKVAPFSNVEEFRRLVTQFTQSPSPADSFRFNCQCDDDAVPVRVLLARIRERTSSDRTKSVLVHIRRGDSSL